MPATSASQRAIANVKQPSKRPPLVFDVPHVFRIKSERSLAHLKTSREFLPCAACANTVHERPDMIDRPHSSHVQQHRSEPLSMNQRPSTAIKQRSCLPPTPANIERLSRPKSVPPRNESLSCNWNNFIRNKSKYGRFESCLLF
jgi:hypothetical protein